MPTLPNYFDNPDEYLKQSNDAFSKLRADSPLPNKPIAPVEEQGAIADVVDKFQEGFYNTTGSIGTGLRGVFTDDQDQWDWEASQYGAAKRQQDTLSTAQKEADAKLGFGEGKELNVKNVTGLIASGLGSLGPSAIGGGLPGAVLKGGARFAMGANAASKAGQAIQKGAQAAGYAAGGAIQIGGATKNQVSEEIGRMSPDNLMMMPDFKALIDSNIPFEQARKQFAHDQSQIGLTQGGILGAVSMGTLGPVLERIVMGNLGKSAITKVLGGAGTEGIQEFAEEGGQQRIANPLTGKDDWDGVLESAALGAIGGVGAGGIAGGAGALLQPRNPDDIPINDDQGNVIGYQDQKTGEKYSPIDISNVGLPRSDINGKPIEQPLPEIQTPGFGRGGVREPGQIENQMPIGPEQPSTVQNPTNNKIVPDTGSLSNMMNASANELKQYDAPLEGDVMGGELATQDKATKPELEVDAIEGEFTKLQDGEQQIQHALDQGLITPEDADYSFQYIEQKRAELNEVMNNVQSTETGDTIEQQSLPEPKIDKKAVDGESKQDYEEYKARVANQYALDKKAPKTGPFDQPSNVVGKNERGENIYQDEEGKRFIKSVEGAKGENKFYEREDKGWKNPRFALVGEPTGELKTSDSEQAQGGIEGEVTDIDNSMISTGEELITQSGRKIISPKIDATGPIKTRNTIKRVNEWLKKEASEEVKGNSYQETLVNAIDIKNISQSDQDTLNMIVWGDTQVGKNNRINKQQSPQFNNYKTAIEKLERGISQGLSQEIKMDERLNDGEADELLKLNRQKLVDKKKKSITKLSDPDLKTKLDDAKTTAKKFDDMGIKIDADFASVPMIDAEIKKRAETTKEVPIETELVDEKSKSRLTIETFKNPKGADRIKVTGDTFALKDEIKAIGGASWARSSKAWTFPASKQDAVRKALSGYLETTPEKDAQGRTEAQKEAGNYKKIHKKWNGLDIAIENAEGTVRSGTDEDGKVWEVTMENDYGYIKRTTGADGDHVDVFMGPNLTSDKVYVVNQTNTDGSFDEHKVMTGFTSKDAAEKGYLANYEQGWSNYADISETTVEGFKTWLKQDSQKKPADFEETKEVTDRRNILERIKRKSEENNRNKKPDKLDVQTETTKDVDVKKSEKVNDKPKNYGKQNTIFTEDAATKARELLKKKLGGQLNVGIDPEVAQAGLTLAGYHIEAGARKFADFTKAMVNDLGEGIIPYLRGWYENVRYYPGFDNEGMSTAAEIEAAPTLKEETISPIDKFYDEIKAGTAPTNLTQMRKWMNKNGMDGADLLDVKKAQEYYEAAQVRVARDIVSENGTRGETYNKLVEMYKKQPVLHAATSTSVKNQAFSTPAPLAYIASELAGITNNTTVYEPTAGNGMLLIGADPKKSTVNELETLRAENLSANGFRVTNNDATTYLPQKEHDVMIANPPFGNLGRGNEVKIDGYTIREIDHVIAAKALKSIKNDGAATIIIGASKNENTRKPNDKIFFNWLYANYNVVDHFEVNGDLYRRQGAGWPVAVITIKGRVDNKAMLPISENNVKRLNTWEEIYEHSNEVVDSSKPIGQDFTGTTSGQNIKTSEKSKSGSVPGQTGSKISRSDKQGKSTDITTGDTKSTIRGARVRTSTVGTGGTLSESDKLDGRTNKVTGGYTGASDQVEPNDNGKPDSKSTTLNEIQSDYVTSSKGFNEGIYTPSGLAEATQHALTQLKQQVGDLDNFVQSELGYKSETDLFDAFMGLQVDGIAMTINNLKKNKGMIIADQTGVGKGRQAAAIIRWAIKNGKTPIFMTEKPNLFTDMYNDLGDIDSHNVKPFILNQAEAINKKDKDENITRIFNTGPTKYKQILGTKKLPSGLNALFSTYSQIQDPGNKQQNMIENMVANDDVIFILDESHNVGGTDSNRGKFMDSMLRATPNGAVYLSATFAKRPDNMPIYFKTDLGDATDSKDGLITAIEGGGVLMQTVVSNQLAQSGQLIRREKSFEGIEIKSVTIGANDPIETKRQQKLADGFTTILRGITSADKSFHVGFVAYLKKQVGDGKSAVYIPGTEITSLNVQSVAASVDHTGFTSVVHNKIKQLLFVAKAEESAKLAIASLKVGNKPVIAVDDTLETFLKNYATRNGVIKDGSLEGLSFKDILQESLDRSRRLRIVLPTGDKEVIPVSLEDLDTATRQSYDRAQRLIDEMDTTGLPVSPIDMIRHKIEKAGYSVKEITGRSQGINYNDMTLMDIPESGSKKRFTTVDEFNTNKIDVVILNQAGATGLSLHSSEKLKENQRQQREMIVTQPSLDISVFMQMLGRVNRTGQVNKPKFKLLSLNIPAEIRPNAILSNKMKSLNANTSSDTKSNTSVKSADIMNKYGNEVVAEYLRENPQLRSRLDVKLDSENIVQIATGRLAILPVKRQKEFYDVVQDQYNEYIDQLNKMNRNDLEKKIVDLQAKELTTDILYPGKKPGSIFGGNAYIGEFEVQKQGFPPTGNEVVDIIDTFSKGRSPSAIINEIVAEKEEQAKDHIAKLEKADTDDATIGISSKQRMPEFHKTKREVDRALQTFTMGQVVNLKIEGESMKGVVTGVKNTHKKGTTGNPFALSKTSIRFAVDNAYNSITLPLSKLMDEKSGYESKDWRSSITDVFDKPEASIATEKRFIVTNNLLQGYSKVGSGNVIQFTKENGDTDVGILLPNNYKQNTDDMQWPVTNVKDVLKMIEDGTQLESALQGSSINRNADGGLSIEAGKSKGRASSVIQDETLLSLVTGNEFSKVGGGQWRANVSSQNADNAIKRFMELFPLTVNRKIAEKYGLVEDVKTSKDDDLSKVTKQNVVEHEDFSFTGVSKPAGLSERSIYTIINETYGRPLSGNSKFSNLEIINDKNQKWRGKFSPRTKKVTLNSYYLSRDDAVRILHHEKIHEYIKENAELKKVGDKILAKAKKYPNSAAGKALEIAKRRVPEAASDYDRRIYEETLAYLIQYYNKPDHASVLKELINTIRKFFAKQFGMFMNEADAVDYVAKMVKAESDQYQDVPVLQTKQKVTKDTDEYSSLGNNWFDKQAKEPLTENEKLNRQIREQNKTLWDKAKKTLKRNLTAGGLLPDSVQALRVTRDGKMGAVEIDMGQLVRGLEKGVGKPFHKLTPVEEQRINNALTGNIDPNLSEPIKTAVIAMRQYIDSLSVDYAQILKEEINALKADGKDATSEARAALLETIANNMGEYVHRSYRAFDDPKWPNKVPSKVLNNAREYLKEQYTEQASILNEKANKLKEKQNDPKFFSNASTTQKDKLETLAEKYISQADDILENMDRRTEATINTILKDDTAYDNIEAFIRESKLGAKDLSILKKRKVIAPEILALLGQHTDARVNFTKSATKMSRLVFNQRFLNKVKEIGMGDFLFTKDDRPANTKRIKESETYSPLSGLYTYPEVDQAFRDALGKEDLPDWYRTLVQINGMVKYGKTVLSPTTAARNWFSAFFFTMANGHFNMKHMKKSLKNINGYFKHEGDLSYLRELKELGVVYDTPYAGEMMKLLEDSAIEDKYLSGNITFKETMGMFTKFYQYGDDFWKIIGYENEINLLMKHKGLTKEQAKPLAAKRIRDTYPTYSMTGRWIQKLRRFPLAGTFVSFPAEIIRTTFNMIRYLQDDMKDPKLKGLAMQRMAGLTMVSGFTYALQAMAMSMLGIDDDEEEAIRNLAAPWNKNSNIMPTGRDKNGNIRFIDLSFLDPYNYFKRPINALMRDQPIDSMMKESAREMLTPFFGTDITFGAISDIWHNKKDTGGRVYNPAEGSLENAQDIANHLRKNVQPGVISLMERTFKAVSGTKSPSGKVYNLPDEMMGAAGWRITTFDPKEAIRYKTYEFADKVSDAHKIVNRIIRSPNKVSDSELTSAYRSTMTAHKRAYNDMITLVNAAKKSGLNNRQIYSMLKSGGVSKRNIGYLLRGSIPTWVPSRNLSKSAYEVTQKRKIISRVNKILANR